jgi:response regulator NasT
MEKQTEPTKFNILLIDEDIDRANSITSALDNSRYTIKHLLSPSLSLLKVVDQLQPDIIVIDMESPNRDMLESLHTISSFNPKPVVIFSEEQDTEVINLSTQSGVSAYVVGKADPNRVKPILDAAVARFHEYHKLKSELDATKLQLEGKMLVDQAKRILIKKKGMTENEAFHSMRRTAMDTGQKIEDVARTMIAFMNSIDEGGL